MNHRAHIAPLRDASTNNDPNDVVPDPTRLRNTNASRLGLVAIKRWFIQQYPAASFRVSGFIGHLSSVVSPVEGLPEDVEALFGSLPRGHANRTARSSQWLASKNKSVGRLVKRVGFERLAPFVECHGAEHLRALRSSKQPAILISWHVGPFLAIASALYGLGIPTLFVIKRQPRRLPTNFQVRETGRNALQRSLTLKHALEWLRAGGVVVIAGDGKQGSATIERPCLGRKLPFQRGPAVLARLTGAPLVPVVAAWNRNGRTIHVTIHEALPRPDIPAGDGQAYDRALLIEAAGWFERYIRSAPGELDPYRLREFARAPRVESVEDPAGVDDETWIRNST